jgi:Flp pilus assembly protein TadG
MTIIGGIRQLAPRSRSGQSLVEFVLIAPMLLLLIFGMVEFARAWNIRHVLTDAAREGVRVLVLPPHDTLVAQQAIATALAATGLNIANATVTYNTAVVTPGNDPACEITIVYPVSLGGVGMLLSWALPQRQLQIGTRFLMRNQT